VDLVSDVAGDDRPDDSAGGLGSPAPVLPARPVDVTDAGQEESSALAAERDALARQVEALVEESAALRGVLAAERERAGVLEREYRADHEALTADLAAVAAERAEMHARLRTQQEHVTALEETLAAERRANEAALVEREHAHRRLVSALRDEIAGKEIALREARDGLALSITDRVLFPSGQATLTAHGRALVDTIAKALVEVPDRQIFVEGHTDDVPIGLELESRFASNWELSAARASEVLKHLAARGRITPDRLVAVGRADTMPVASNATESGRRQNRRIEIILRPAPATGDDSG
jgi:chemotaxis protein MotB